MKIKIKKIIIMIKYIFLLHMVMRNLLNIIIEFNRKLGIK